MHFLKNCFHTLVLTLALLLPGKSLFADQGHKAPQGIITLPFALHIVMDNQEEFGITPEQLGRFSTELTGVYPAKMRPRMQEIHNLETTLRMDIMQNLLTSEEAAAQLKVLGEQKYKLSMDHIHAMNTLGEILTSKQWELMIEKLALGKSENTGCKIANSSKK